MNMKILPPWKIVLPAREEVQQNFVRKREKC